MNIIFREADLANSRDSKALVVLLNEFMHGKNTTNVKIIDCGIIQKLTKLGTSKVYLCEYSEDIIGIAVCFIGFSTFKQKELLNIHDLFIKEEFQGKGIGTKFLKYIEKECLKNDFCRITLKAYDDNLNAIKLYEKSGFIGSKNSQHNLIYAMKKDLE